MALKVPSRRLADPASSFASLLRVCPSCRSTATLLPRIVHRTAATRTKKLTGSNPVLENYLKNKPSTPQPSVTRGTVAEDSIFEDELKQEAQAEADKQAPRKGTVMSNRNPDNLANVLDPAPRSRMRWERKVVIQQIKKRGRVPKRIQLKRTERESLNKSQFFKTSVKKLGKLAQQIAGKPIEEAIVQMQYSTKKVAQDVKKHLEYSRDMAIVSRGMGLGKAEGREGEPVEIELKDGKRKLVKDRTGIYIDQAWVGRGTYTTSPEYRARGRVNILRHPFTSISVLLKEEATRIRLSEQKQKKKLNRKLWLHLPDRPITMQRQYPLW